MKRLLELWKMFTEKIYGATVSNRGEAERTKRTLVVAPPSFPEIPQPKERPKDRYTVLVLAESGDAKQLVLSKSRLKVIAVSGSVALAFLVILALGIVKHFSRAAQQAQKTPVSVASLSENPVNPVHQALGGRNDGTKPPDAPSDSVLTPRVPEPIKDGEQANRPPQSAQESAANQKTATTTNKNQPGESGSHDSGSSLSSVVESENMATAKRSPEPFVINFDAQQLTATLEAPNNGTLSFRLIKDQPDVKFAGYLFVYVEMEDQRGENRIYVYPKQTRLGEGDLPFDFRDGENIAFKFNSRVELPYGDARASASLAGVSILLYGENGKIVFQRTFGRQEVAMVSTKSNKAERPKPRPTEKRQAL